MANIVRIAERVARVELFMPVLEDPSTWQAVAHYETVGYDADDKPVQGAVIFGIRRVVRNFGDVTDEERASFNTLRDLMQSFGDADAAAAAEAEPTVG